MKFIQLTCGILLCAGCIPASDSIRSDTVARDPTPEVSCLFTDLKGAGGVRLQDTTGEHWIRLVKQRVEYGYSGETNSEAIFQHVSCTTDECRFKRIDDGLSGEFYLKVKGKGTVEFGKLNDTAFPVLLFRHEHPTR